MQAYLCCSNASGIGTAYLGPESLCTKPCGLPMPGMTTRMQLSYAPGVVACFSPLSRFSFLAEPLELWNDVRPCHATLCSPGHISGRLSRKLSYVKAVLKRPGRPRDFQEPEARFFGRQMADSGVAFSEDLAVA